MKTVFKILKYGFVFLIASSILVSAVGAGALIYFSKDLPKLMTIEDYKPHTVTQVIGKGDVVVGEFFEEKRYVISMDKIPEHLIRAFVSAEDDRFFEHQGIDIQGIIRAAIANLRAGRVVQGGSTITQQVAKSLLLTPERSFLRKIRELILASRMEKNFGKKQILYLYLNQIYLGQGAYGVEAASRVYFNKSASEVSVAEAAILAGLPQAPSKYSPLINPKSAKQRQLYVLRRMHEDGAISKADMDKAAETLVKIYPNEDLRLKYDPYYVEYVRKYLLDKYGKDALYDSGMKVYVPLDPNLGIAATRTVQEGLRSIDKRQGYRGPIAKVKPDQLEEILDDIKEYNLAKRFAYKIMTTNGEISTDIENFIDNTVDRKTLLNEGELYQAIVTSVDDFKKQVLVDLGILKGKIPLENMSWAAMQRGGLINTGETITRPSQSLAKGDKVWVRYIPQTKTEDLVFALEQVPALQGALLSMDVMTGEVLSMVGGYDFKDSEFNRAMQAERQNGSIFKPVIYSAAVDKGYTPATVIQDSPIVFDKGENEKWKPENFEEKFFGDTLFRSALIKSRNIPTIKIVQDIQVPYLIEYAKRLGLPDKFNRDLSIALGSSTETLFDMCKVFSIFPRGGRKITPIFITKILDREGAVLEETKITPNIDSSAYTGVSPIVKPVMVAGQLQTDQRAGQADPDRGSFTPDPNDSERVMDPRTAFVMTHLMNEVATVGTGSHAKDLGRPAAGKTGTTNDALDAWFMGFTPSVVTGVWVGFDTQKSIGSRATGGGITLPIWVEFMKEAVKSYPIEDFKPPKGVVYAFIDGKTGKPANPNNPNSVKEVFIEGTQPGAIGLKSSLSTLGGKGDSGNAPTQAPVKDSDDEGFFKQDIE